MQFVIKKFIHSQRMFRVHLIETIVISLLLSVVIFDNVLYQTALFLKKNCSISVNNFFIPSFSAAFHCRCSKIKKKIEIQTIFVRDLVPLAISSCSVFNYVLHIKEIWSKFGNDILLISFPFIFNAILRNASKFVAICTSTKWNLQNFLSFEAQLSG